MAKVSRAQRAHIQRTATTIRQQGQRAGWGVEQIAATICDQIPTISRLEAWRLAYGWSRRQTLDAITTLYETEGLAPPAVNTSMLCRWEHGQTTPCQEYAAALTCLYRATPDQLGLTEHTTAIARVDGGGWYRQPHVATNRGHDPPMTDSSDHGSTGLAALRESIELALDAEGPAGGPETVAQLEAAVAYYSLHYNEHPPQMLATEVHRCRALVTSALRSAPVPLANNLRQVAGWLSGLLGNLAFYLADYPAAHIHLSTAARLGLMTGDNRLVAWSLGAQSMVAYFQHRPVEALDLAEQALSVAVTPLQEAQLLAWAKLRPLSVMGRASQAHATMLEARRRMDADPIGHQPGRFGFDAPTLTRHIAEAHLHLGEPDAAQTHATTVVQQTRPGRARWAAATLVLAQAEALKDRPDQAAELGHSVLDATAPGSLRETTRQRLHTLDSQLTQLADPGRQAVALNDRLAELPALVAPDARSDEPNEHG